ncbi:MAG TPA: hypothetical protein VHO25_25140 [Polyangiaceae bacterium]|nr:hypothetical protein [Polyangiaceae bacterium]
MDAVRYRLELEEVPADFFADPDGEWTYEELVTASGFDAETQTVCIGALTQAFRGHPAGAAVVTTAERHGRYVAIIECALPDVATRVA